MERGRKIIEERMGRDEIAEARGRGRQGKEDGTMMKR